jgi:phage baseplate assembly protein W
MRPLAFPFAIDRTGRTARSQPGREIRELIEQLLFTAPGERVMRPTLGSGVAQLVFAPAGEQHAASAQHLVQAGLQTWLGDRILVDTVEARAEDAVLTITVRYRDRLTGVPAVETVTGEV